MAKCYDCSKQAYPGMTRCLNCLMLDKQRRKKYYQRHRKKLLAMYKKRREYRAANDLCAMCGKPLNHDYDAPRICVNCNERIHRWN